MRTSLHLLVIESVNLQDVWPCFEAGNVASSSEGRQLAHWGSATRAVRLKSTRAEVWLISLRIQVTKVVTIMHWTTISIGLLLLLYYNSYYLIITVHDHWLSWSLSKRNTLRQGCWHTAVQLNDRGWSVWALLNHEQKNTVYLPHHTHRRQCAFRLPMGNLYTPHNPNPSARGMCSTELLF